MKVCQAESQSQMSRKSTNTWSLPLNGSTYIIPCALALMIIHNIMKTYQEVDEEWNGYLLNKGTTKNEGVLQELKQDSRI